MKKCPFCNGEINDDAVFCPECRKDVTQGMQPEPAQPGKKKGKLIAAGAVVAAVAAVGIFAGVKLMEKDPKDVVIDAFKGVYSSDISYPSEEVFGWKKIVEKSMEENMEGTFSLALDQSNNALANMFSGTEITSFSQSDVKNKKAYGEFGIRVANMDLISMDIYADQEKIGVAIPELSEKVFTLDYANDLEGQIEASPFAGPMLREAGIDASVLKDYMDYLWSFYNTEGDRPFDIQALWNRYKEGSQAISNFKEAMTVEKADGSEFTVNGTITECKGYNVVIPQQAMIDFVESTSQFFMEDEGLKNDVLEYLSQIIAMGGGASVYGMSAEEMQQEAWTALEDYTDQLITAMENSADDISMTVYVDKKGQLAALEGNTSLDIEGQTLDIKVDAELQGGSYPTENAQMNIDLETSDGTVTIAIVKEGEYTDAALTSGFELTLKGDGEEISLSFDSDYDRETGDYVVKLAAGNGVDEGSLDIEGNVSNLVPGESFDIAMDTIKVNWAGEELATLSGSYGLKPLEGEVAMPEGEEVDVLAATAEEWNEIGQEMSGNIEEIAMTFQSLLSGVMSYMYMGGF